MARPREFDADVALERAMDLLWTRGYEATSLDDLCEVTGLSRSSFYATFGSKRKLLLRSVDRYVERRVSHLRETLIRPVPVLETFGALLDDFIDRIVEGSGRRGCFLGNCAAELPRNDHAALMQVREGLSRTEAVFREALAAAKTRGELRPDADVRALARFLTAGIQGLRLVGKVNPDRAALKDIASTMLRCLDGKDVRKKPGRKRPLH